MRKIEIPEFKIRCSQIGKIMKNDRSGKCMGETAKTYCEHWLKERIYNRTKDIKSKYLDKGNLVESDSIEFVSEQLKLGMVFKNEDHFEDEYKKGTPDIKTRSLIIDIKNSWDFETFPLLDDKVNPDYFAQLQGYMDLTNIDNAKLVYVLSDTPENLINDEIRRFSWKLDMIEIPEEVEETIRKNLTYSDIPAELKIKCFDVKRDPDYIKQVHERVIECRAYIKTLLNTLN